MRWTDFGCSASAEAGPWWSTAIGRPLQRIEILLLNVIFIAPNIRNRVGTMLNRAAVVSLLIRITYVYSAISLVIGIGGGFTCSASSWSSPWRGRWRAAGHCSPLWRDGPLQNVHAPHILRTQAGAAPSSP